LQAEQAQTLHRRTEGLQMLGKAFIGAGREDKSFFARMIDNARITRSNAEVFARLAEFRKATLTFWLPGR